MNLLELARQKRKAMAEQGVKVVHLSFKEKLLQNPTSRSLAIAAKCWECAGDGADGHKMTKDTIRTCKSRVHYIGLDRIKKKWRNSK